MPEKGFDLSGFRSPPIEREFLPREDMKSGQGVKLLLNLDHLTLERMEMMDTKFNNIFDGSLNVLKAMETAINDANIVDEKPNGKKAPKSKQLAVAGKKPEPRSEFEIPRVELFAFEKAKLRFYVEVLAGEPGNEDPYNRLIHGWDVMDGSKPVPVCYKSFLQLPPHGLLRMYRFVIGAANNPTTEEKKI